MRILIADKSPEVRSALRLLLENEPGIIVAGEANEIGELIERVGSIHPDIVLLDWHLADLRAKELLPALRAVCTRLYVIAICGRPEKQREALDAGADAFISKVDSPENLLSVIHGCCLR